MNPRVLRWLLEPENPSVRYLALRALCDRPEDDPEVAAARTDITAYAPVRAILSAQYPDGYWMRPGRGYSPRHKATVWQVLILADLGAPLTSATARACAHVLANTLRPERALFCAHAHSTGLYPCLNGNLLRALLHFGFGAHPTVRGVPQTLARHVLDTEYACPRASTNPRDQRSWRPCPWGCIKVLRACAALSTDQRTPLVQRAIEHGAGMLLERDLAQDHRPALAPCQADWLRFGFPLGETSDLLEALLALVEAGLAGEVAASQARALELVRARQDPTGRWALERALPNTWADVGQEGEPNKWITLRAWSVLQATGQ